MDNLNDMERTAQEGPVGLGERIRELRRSKGLSQEELAGRTGVSRQAVSKWEMDQSLPELDKLLALSRFFQVSADYLLKGEERAQPKKADARIFAVVATALNAVGLLVAVAGWIEEQTARSISGGLVATTMGCMVFAVGRVVGEQNSCRRADKLFWPLNLWLLAPIPLAALIGALARLRFGPFDFAKAWVRPKAVALGLAVYVLLCAAGDWAIVRALARKNRR